MEFDMERELGSIREQLVRLDAKLDARFDSFASLYVPRKELQVVHDNSEKQQEELALKVNHIDREMGRIQKQVANITTTFRNYAVVAGFVIAIVQTVFTTILIKFIL